MHNEFTNENVTNLIPVITYHKVEKIDTPPSVGVDVKNLVPFRGEQLFLHFSLDGHLSFELPIIEREKILDRRDCVRYFNK